MWETGEVHTKFFGGNLRERNHLEDLGVDGRILKCIFKKLKGVRTLSGSGQVVVSCECGNELSGSIKYRELPD